ncbi:MAG: nucleoside triphosphate pyrophosphohydrolase, partial [Chloroflexi bacterium]|nr:nucleoside triphosphate pyrophosphohydrolase [Chloroflexota bacterium]
ATAKLALLELYPDEHPVTIVRAAGVPGQEQVVTVPLYQLDRQPWIDHLTCAYLPPLPVEQATRTFAALQYILSRLRNPDGGCPWDRAQTHQTLKSSLLEETYEVLAALDDEAPDKLQEELGDLWLQIILHAQIASERDEFTLGEVLHSINSKLLRRHAHVFGDVRLADSAAVLRHWERIKRGEREANGEVGEERSALSGVPAQLPALAYSQAIQERAARLGFDWQELEGVLRVVADELAELQAASTADERRAEFGDVLFALVNAARWLGLDAEEALRLANRRFVRRFQAMEALCRERGLDFVRLSFEEQNALWAEVKKAEQQ